MFSIFSKAKPYGLQSVNAVPNGHKFSDNLSFQSSPELHCALFKVSKFCCSCVQHHMSVFLNDFIKSLHVSFQFPLRLCEGDRCKADLGCSYSIVWCCRVANYANLLMTFGMTLLQVPGYWFVFVNQLTVVTRTSCVYCINLLTFE